MLAAVVGAGREMRKAGLVAAGLCLSLLLPSGAGAQDAAATAAFRELNDAAIAIYRDAKQRFLAQAGPVVIAGNGEVAIRDRAGARRFSAIPAGYEILKSVDHVPRSLWAAVRPQTEELDPSDSWRDKLTELRPRADAALQALPQSGLSAAATARAEETLRGSLALIDRYLAEGPPTEAELRKNIRAFAPALWADAAEAARAQIDALDREVRPWWTDLSQAERERTYVVVISGKTSTPGNLTYSYFLDLLGPAEDGRRVIHGEGIADEKGAEALLATLLTDRRLSTDFFADERRMERDLLADGAAARLRELFPPPPEK